MGNQHTILRLGFPGNRLETGQNIPDIRFRGKYGCEKATKKIRATLQYLRQNGFCDEDSTDDAMRRLKRFCEDPDGFSGSCELDEHPMLSLMQAAKNYLGQYGAIVSENSPWDIEPSLFADDHEIEDIGWHFGIEMALAQHNPGIVCDEEIRNLGRYAIPYIRDVYCHTILFSYAIGSAISVRELEGYSDELVEELDEKVDDSALAEAAENLESWENELQEQKKQIASEKAETEAKLTEMQRRLKEREAEIYRLKKENQALSEIAEAAEFEREMSEESEDLETIEKKIEVLDRLDSVEIPKEGVLFVGGHPRMLAVLRNKYPGWTFVESDSDAKIFSEPGFRPGIVLLWHRHISHSVYNKLTDNLPKETPIGYITAQNAVLMEQQIRRHLLRLREV